MWGAKMLDTGLGRVLTAVKERVVHPAKVPRGFPSTQLCSTPAYPYRARKSLAERVHICPECGLELDRDINAAQNIEEEGLRVLSTHDNLGAERNRSHARGDLPSTLTERMVAYYHTIPEVRARWVAEAGSPRHRVSWTRRGR